jgi:hypothetical protein
MADSHTNRTIEDLRTHLSEKLEELHRRASTASQALAPATYWRDPWVRFGLGVVLGLALAGRRRGSGPESLVHAVVRAGLTATTSALVTRALTDRLASGEPHEPAARDPRDESTAP